MSAWRNEMSLAIAITLLHILTQLLIFHFVMNAIHVDIRNNDR